MLLIETIFDTNNASIAIDCARQAAPKLPIMLSFSVSTPDGHNMLGQDIVDFIDALPKDGIISVGINCVTNVPQMIPLVCRLATKGLMVSLYPNAGHPDANGHYSKTPEGLLADVWPLLENHCLNFIGGWKCWGNRTAVYPATTDPKDSFIPVERMFTWVGNILVQNYWFRLDFPITRRQIDTILDSVNLWLNGLAARQFILGGRVEFMETENSNLDLMDGILRFHVYLTPPSPNREIDFILEYDPEYLSTLFS